METASASQRVARTNSPASLGSVYISSSLLENWDKGGADNEQFVRGFSWDGKELKPTFEVDFNKEKLGRAHHMKLGSKAMKAAYGLERTATLR